jgi:hypothetical protein
MHAQRTSKDQPLQLRPMSHPQEARCQRHCPSYCDPIVCTHRSPSGSPLAISTTHRDSSPAGNRLSPQHATSSIHSRRSQAPAQSAAAANARSVLLRSSDVSCVILPRLGARLRHRVMRRQLPRCRCRTGVHSGTARSFQFQHGNRAHRASPLPDLHGHTAPSCPMLQGAA